MFLLAAFKGSAKIKDKKSHIKAKMTVVGPVYQPVIFCVLSPPLNVSEPDNSQRCNGKNRTQKWSGSIGSYLSIGYKELLKCVIN